VAVFTSALTRRRKIICGGLIALFALAVSLFADRLPGLYSEKQHWVIAGRVEDEDTHAGLAQATVNVEGASTSTTEDNGNFRIELKGAVRKAPRLRMSVSKPGFKTSESTAIPPQDDYIVFLSKL
jgi:hypothetical protein